ncbi:Transposase [Mycoavidus cysteinexigens]|uniref:Transposase n=1 Tax=Mycoavidus cysteinexigens TaxID=1553431 RepID=A0A2Z6EX44_9BURK|nr:Transposase [Mycoavidus cysteinexigens]GAM53662.1 putative transposase [bacterium endosymbiont of Mortierella elongata FMR23-6]GLR02115.1 hypothetical protein GCM10007934_19290 [Mycoavidus cysteinexigens]
MDKVKLVGIDLGKKLFRVHGQHKAEWMALCKKLTRKQLLEFFNNFQTTMVVMEACAGAHQMAWELVEFGHQVKLIPPLFVRPFVKSNELDG